MSLVLLAGGVVGARAAAVVKPRRLLVQPASLELRGPGDEHGLLVTAVTGDGRTVDVTDQARFASKTPETVTVSSNGVCRALADGSVEIVVEFGGKSARVSVSVTDAARSGAPSFRQEVLPVLTKAGCNSGACHGKLAGQNGFKLSLRGYAPELDYGWLTTDLNGRRINPAAPGDSLLVLKPLGAVPHEGHQRFAEGSRYHRLLVDWIAHRAPGPVAAETDAVRLEILPGNRTVRTNETQQLLARAHYADGRVRDVTDRKSVV